MLSLQLLINLIKLQAQIGIKTTSPHSLPSHLGKNSNFIPFNRVHKAFGKDAPDVFVLLTAGYKQAAAGADW